MATKLINNHNMFNLHPYKRKTILLFWLFSLVALQNYAQNRTSGSKISGTILDSVTHTPIPYAAVSIYLKGQSDVAGGILTDDNGKFLIDSVAPGKYKLKIDYVSYKTKSIEDIDVKPGDNKMGTIVLSSTAKAMKEVTVTGTKSFVENKVDKMVFNVGNEITSAGGTAADVLKKVPQVSVDLNGNVELLGNSSIKVLLNGKPSPQFDNNLADALRVIPASQIEKIEVITSPGAQYDAEGTGGIINIILKESKVSGLNGSFNVSAGTRNQNSSLTLHAQKDKLSFNLSLGGNYYLPSSTITSLMRTSDSAGAAQTKLNENGTGTFEMGGYRGQLGMDWDISKNDHFSVSFGTFNHTSKTTNTSTQDLNTLLPISTDVNTGRTSLTKSQYDNYEGNMNYKKSFAKKGQELSANLSTSLFQFDNNFQQNQNYINNPTYFAGTKGSNTLKEYETIGNLDYTHPLPKDIILNVGGKGTFTRINSYSVSDTLVPNTNTFNQDPGTIDNFLYDRDIYAGYVSVTAPIFKVLTLKVGVRDEYTKFYRASLNDSLIPSYNTVVPSAVLSWKFKKTQSLKLSYAYRLQRPGWWNMNPYIEATDPLNMTQGNPKLVPEKVNNFDLTYFRSFEKGSNFMIMPYCRYSTDDEQSYVLFKDSLKIGSKTYKNVSLSTNENVGNQTVYGLSLSGTLKLFDEKLELRGNFNVFGKYIVSTLTPGATSSSTNYRANMNMSYKFTKTFVAECFVNYRSAQTEIQGTFPGWINYNIAFKKLFWDNNGSLAFTTANPFNAYQTQNTNIAGQNFTLQSNSKFPWQSFNLAFTYKFGKLKYEENNQNEGDMGEGGIK